jgi:hypothetical protein
MSRFKQIKRLEDFHDNDPDSCAILISYNKEMTEIVLTVKSNRALNPEEYFDSVAEFLNEVSEKPETLFVEDIDNEGKSGLH